MIKRDSIWRFGSSLRVGIFVVSQIVLIIYLVRDPGANKAVYIILGVGFMGLIHEIRQWRINRMSGEEQISATLSASEKKLD